MGRNCTERATDGGSFGAWIEDEHGLPAYEYTCDQDAVPAAAAFTTGRGSNVHFHQVGNDRITAVASNRGEVQALESSRGLQWLNYYDARRLCPGGGIALLIEGGRMSDDLYRAGAPGRGYRRIFGAGYFRKIGFHGGLRLDHRVIAPFGDDPVLVCEAVLMNETGAERRVRLMEFFGVNLHYMAGALLYTTRGRRYFHPAPGVNLFFRLAAGAAGNLIDAEARRDRFARRFFFRAQKDAAAGAVYLSPEYRGARRPPRDRPSSWNYYPRGLFLSSLSGAAEEVHTDARELVKRSGGFRDKPLAVGGGEGREILPPCLCVGADVSVMPGETQRRAFLFGAADRPEAERLIARYRETAAGREDFFSQSAAARLKHAAVFTAPTGGWNAAREAKWNSYYSRSAFLYDESHGRHYTPQGGAYEYLHGMRGAVRDLALFSAGLIYLAPELSRELLEYCFRLMTRSGRIMYAAHGFGKATGAVVHGRPSDLQLFLLWALTEYVFFTRDFGFLDRAAPFHPRGSGESSIRERVCLALEYIFSRIGLGRHGLMRAGDGDWNDGISLFVRDRGRFIRRGESAFNTAMALYVLPRAADLAEEWDRDAACRAREFAWKLREAVVKSFNGRWFPRAYDGAGRPLGDDRLFLEHHAWLLISRALPESMARSVVENVHDVLDAPSAFGQYVLYPPMKTPLGHFAPGWDVNGGAWYAMGFLLAWGYGKYDPAKAWECFRKNSMAHKATVYPDVWYGIWTGPDSINADYARRPGETFFHVPTPGTDFPGMNLNLHACFIAALVKLCGIEPGKDGVEPSPLLPFDEFALETPTFRVERRGGVIKFERKRQVAAAKGSTSERQIQNDE
ncbi:MAG: hypothetical protein AB1742_02890 [bacterium]